MQQLLNAYFLVNIPNYRKLFVIGILPIAKPAISVAFDLKEQRRLSLDLGEPVIEFFANMFPGFLKNITITTKSSSEDMAKLAVSYIEAIKMSSMHTREDMTRWFDANFPSLESTDRDFKAFYTFETNTHFYHCPRLSVVASLPGLFPFCG